MPSRNTVVPVETGPHAVPSQRRVAPESPTAQTSFAALPQTAVRSVVLPLATDAQPEPSQCAVAPPLPTAQTSDAPLPHSPAKSVDVELLDIPVCCR